MESIDCENQPNCDDYVAPTDDTKQTYCVQKQITDLDDIGKEFYDYLNSEFQDTSSIPFELIRKYPSNTKPDTNNNTLLDDEDFY